MAMETYNKRKEKGLCPRCGDVSPTGRVFCLNCAAHNCVISQRRKDKHLCERCSTKVTGARVCNSCRLQQREAKNTQYQSRKRNGLCVYCGEVNPVSATRNSCDICASRLRIKRRTLNLRVSKEEKLKATAALNAFDNRCQICGAANAGHKFGWTLDHCHATNKFRGILCQPCNLLLGNAKDNINTLSNSILYLKRFEESLHESNRIFSELQSVGC